MFSFPPYLLYLTPIFQHLALLGLVWAWQFLLFHFPLIVLQPLFIQLGLVCLSEQLVVPIRRQMGGCLCLLLLPVCPSFSFFLFSSSWAGPFLGCYSFVLPLGVFDQPGCSDRCSTRSLIHCLSISSCISFSISLSGLFHEWADNNVSLLTLMLLRGCLLQVLLHSGFGAGMVTGPAAAALLLFVGLGKGFCHQSRVHVCYPRFNCASQGVCCRFCHWWVSVCGHCLVVFLDFLCTVSHDPTLGALFQLQLCFTFFFIHTFLALWLLVMSPSIDSPSTSTLTCGHWLAAGSGRCVPSWYGGSLE